MEKMWSVLLHLGMNMWNEIGNTIGTEIPGSPILRFEQPLFREIAEYGREKGLNTIILDLGEGLKYESHPELAVEGSWSREQMEKELEYLHGLGYDVVPKLNFSTCHDVWLGDYSRMVSSPIYYQVTSDLIKEVCDIFKPKYFHLGMDEEKAGDQRNYLYCVMRQHDLWWHDLYHYIDCVEKENVRPWIWSDAIWDKPEFVEKCPKEVLQSNWYYWLDPSELHNESIEREKRREIQLRAYDLLDSHGFEQVPTGSNYFNSQNMDFVVKYCKEHISDANTLGFMNTPWLTTHRPCKQGICASIDQLSDAKEWYESGTK